MTYVITSHNSNRNISRRNSPTTNVYNQCANVMLRYSIKAKEGHNPPIPKQLYDDKTPVPGPITRRQCRCVVIGFPWYGNNLRIKSQTNYNVG
jgi:DNA (cytosine-5)-methyltransferase 1